MSATGLRDPADASGAERADVVGVRPRVLIALLIAATALAVPVVQATAQPATPSGAQYGHGAGGGGGVQAGGGGGQASGAPSAQTGGAPSAQTGGAPSAKTSGGLPFTGLDLAVLGVIAAVLVAFGGVLLWHGRRGVVG